MRVKRHVRESCCDAIVDVQRVKSVREAWA